ncbi:protein cereblon [Elysia marginata]|uniref:Protein cereblon n=1 Tax=Elysia marginata TaxID=1093978 RepID=A0AAV4IYD0_9GAST|nr:protein cereblon [Elysia marginata]
MADPAEDLLPLLGINIDEGGHRESDDSEFSSGEETDESFSSGLEEEQMEHEANEEIADHQGNGNEPAAEADGEEELPALEVRRHPRIKKRKISLRKKSADSQSQKATIVNFDQSLPSSHSYLGSDLEEVRGRTILEEGSVVTMPLLLLPGVVLVPGQVLPLQLHMQPLVAMVRRVADTNNTFGVLNVGRTNRGDNYQNVSTLGCTAEIFSKRDELDDSSGISIMTVKARGRQRFKIINMKSEVTGEIMGKVRILPELSLTHVLDGARIPSLCRLMVPPAEDPQDMVKTAVDRQGRVLTSVDLRCQSMVTRLTSAHFTWWPPWVYKMYDIDWLAEQIRGELQNWCPASLPPDPVNLSFWVAHNLPVSDDLRLRLLSFDSVVQRLRFGLNVIRKSGRLLCCDQCQEEISSKEHVFSMSQEGPLGAYVNPHGHVHEMFTVTTVQNLNHVGGAYTEHSWFPGYAWTIVQCKQCHNHMGWKFTATKKDLSPRKFWGLCRSSVKTTFGSMDDDDVVEM